MSEPLPQRYWNGPIAGFHLGDPLEGDIELTADEWNAQRPAPPVDNLTPMLQARLDQTISDLQAAIDAAGFSPAQAAVVKQLLTLLKGSS